ncbi:mCG146159, partial [Mus musculus]
KLLSHCGSRTLRMMEKFPEDQEDQNHLHNDILTNFVHFLWHSLMCTC